MRCWLFHDWELIKEGVSLVSHFSGTRRNTDHRRQPGTRPANNRESLYGNERQTYSQTGAMR